MQPACWLCQRSGNHVDKIEKYLDCPGMSERVIKDWHDGCSIYLFSSYQTMDIWAYETMTQHHQPQTFSDKVAFKTTKCLRFLADTFFAKRYGHRAVVLETVAGVPGMVGGMLRHMRSLRRLERDEGWIGRLLDEAQNERMHLMIFLEIAKPTWLERMLILLAQGVFFFAFVLLYIVSSKTAHRLVGYFEEEAVVSYTEYLAEIDAGFLENKPAPQIAIDYYELDSSAKLREVVEAVRSDEMNHRDVNHDLANQLEA